MALLTLSEAAVCLGLKVSTLRFWVWQRRIEHVKVGGAVRIRDSVVKELIDRGTVPVRRDRDSR